MSRDYRLFLDDIRVACQRIADFTQGVGVEQLAADAKSVSAVERQLFIIGEAVKHLPAEVTTRFAEVEGREIAGFRDVLAHGYWKIDPQVLWSTAKEDVPMLMGQIVRILGIVGTPGA